MNPVEAISENKSVESDEDLNQWIHETVMKLCWHESEESLVCDKCDEVFYTPIGGSDPHPDYCNSIEAAWRVVEKMREIGIHFHIHTSNNSAEAYCFNENYTSIISSGNPFMETSLPQSICLAAKSVLQNSENIL